MRRPFSAEATVQPNTILHPIFRCLSVRKKQIMGPRVARVRSIGISNNTHIVNDKRRCGFRRSIRVCHLLKVCPSSTSIPTVLLNMHWTLYNLLEAFWLNQVEILTWSKQAICNLWHPSVLYVKSTAVGCALLTGYQIQAGVHWTEARILASTWTKVDVTN